MPNPTCAKLQKYSTARPGQRVFFFLISFTSCQNIFSEQTRQKIVAAVVKRDFFFHFCSDNCRWNLHLLSPAPPIAPHPTLSLTHHAGAGAHVRLRWKTHWSINHVSSSCFTPWKPPFMCLYLPVAPPHCSCPRNFSFPNPVLSLAKNKLQNM